MKTVLCRLLVFVVLLPLHLPLLSAAAEVDVPFDIPVPFSEEIFDMKDVSRTWPVTRYEQDRGHNFSHEFGIFAPAAGYTDPNFEEGRQMASPLYNPVYQSYDVIVVTNKTDVLSADRQTRYEVAQRVRVYVRQAAFQKLENQFPESRTYDTETGLLYYWKTSTARDGFFTPSGHFRIFLGP